MDRIARYLVLLAEEARRQNLIAESTLPTIWARHVADSAQLIPLADRPHGTWLDLGSGAGLPGIVIALITGAPVVMVESRRRRVEFLQAVIDDLGLGNADIRLSPVERVETFAAVTITARAFAPLPKLFELAHRFSTEKTQWVLPKGRNAKAELEAVALTWHMMFHVEPSITDDAAGIIVARDVRRRRQ
ncbi:hypothetical protein NX02_25380 [Sphingomonas sanxanigenens DSM 19645 = NX02]|uniref:Ribosomal RNA small subunit methyltransferase G n=2 Tax=Sphingomonas sanxanigenens TaxID=397260 RepID=W0AJF3_9SPHN|nr:hypothetical protein NX02_25380 [Sphingomonas sanxanigenens DSM 19645 = NX02]